MGRRRLPSCKLMDKERSKIKHNVRSKNNDNHLSTLFIVSLIILSLAFLVFNTTNSISVTLTHI